MIRPRSLHLLTGEYPPDCGGVADYSAAVAERLALHNVDVHAWCPDGGTHDLANIHRLPGRFGFTALRQLSKGLQQFPAPRTLLVQYVPHAFGCKAMNLPFCLWLLRRRYWYHDDVRTLFHEVAFPFVRTPLHHNIIAIVNRIMAAIVIRASRCIYVSTLAWNPILDSLGGRQVPRTWTPIPSNVPHTPQSDAPNIRKELTAGDPHAVVIGNFGVAASKPRTTLFAIARLLLTELPTARFLFLGRGSEILRDELKTQLTTEQAARVVASGAATLPRLAAYIQACDLSIQAYIDGMSTRRTSGMAWLANGVAMVTNAGVLSEKLWLTDRPTSIAGQLDVDEMTALALGLLREPLARAKAANRGQAYYEAHFSLEHTVQTLLAAEVKP